MINPYYWQGSAAVWGDARVFAKSNAKMGAFFIFRKKGGLALPFIRGFTLYQLLHLVCAFGTLTFAFLMFFRLVRRDKSDKINCFDHDRKL